MFGLGPMECVIVVVIAWLLFRRFTDFFNNGSGWPFSFGAVPVEPTREPVPPPEEKKPDWIIQDQPTKGDRILPRGRDR